MSPRGSISQTNLSVLFKYCFLVHIYEYIHVSQQRGYIFYDSIHIFHNTDVISSLTQYLYFPIQRLYLLWFYIHISQYRGYIFYDSIFIFPNIEAMYLLWLYIHISQYRGYIFSDSIFIFPNTADTCISSRILCTM